MARAGRGVENGGPALHEMFFRLDAAIQHMLLDEFQDTNLAQWRALQPLAREMTDNAPPERTFFCVGDVKQSIYVWRNANPEILERLSATLRSVDEASLDRSWRSSPVVIDVINDVFDGIADNGALEVRDASGDAEDDDSYAEAARLWHERFNRHQVAQKNADLSGFVQVRLGPARQGSDKGASGLQKRLRLHEAARLAAELHRANPRLRIALLTRTNNAVARLLYELGSDDLRVPASGRGGGPLIDAPPVNVLLDALHLADHPEDTVAAFNVARSPLGQALGFTEHARDGVRRRFSRETRQSLLRDGYQQTIARWVQAIAPHCDARELRRAAQMVELAGVQDARAADTPALRPGDFIALVEAKDVPDSQPAPVEVMTVHQAKGLEFDAVILAELDGQLSSESSIVFERDETTGEITRVSRWIGREARDFVPLLRPVVRQHRIRTIRESLSLLYVAMTRPRCALYMFVDPPSDSERDMPRTFGGVVRAALAPAADAPDSIAFQVGDPQWWKQVKSTDGRDHAEEDAGEALSVIDRIQLTRDDDDEGALRGEAAVSPSMWSERSAARKQASALREHLQLRSPEARERGSVIHALFEQIEWLEEFAAEDAALLRIARSVCPRHDDRWHGRCIQAFRKMLNASAIRQALLRGKTGVASIRLLREHPFARIERGLVQSGAIDRLTLVVNPHGRPTAATVIDFKTDALDDRLSEASARAAAEMHRPQLEMYRDAVSDMFALPRDQVTMQVMLVGAGAVVDL
jgi:ATP-dependent exoDNAse (exonuclease V) beta subunit